MPRPVDTAKTPDYPKMTDFAAQRRQVLKAMGVGALAVSVSGCEAFAGPGAPPRPEPRPLGGKPMLPPDTDAGVPYNKLPPDRRPEPFPDHPRTAGVPAAPDPPPPMPGEPMPPVAPRPDAGLPSSPTRGSQPLPEPPQPPPPQPQPPLGLSGMVAPPAPPVPLPRQVMVPPAPADAGVPPPPKHPPRTLGGRRSPTQKPQPPKPAPKTP